MITFQILATRFHLFSKAAVDDFTLALTTKTFEKVALILKSGCKKHHCIETAFRKFIPVAALNMLKRISEMLEENGTEVDVKKDLLTFEPITFKVYW